MGNQNVGKSTIFSRLTGVNVVISNYPGSTVEFKQGHMRSGDGLAQLIDVPGTYALQAASRAEEVAAEMVGEGDVIINVVDATSLERNLFLTFQLLALGKPVVIALNMWDEARHNGITIDADRLSELLGVQVVPTVAATGQGIKRLVSALPKAGAPSGYSEMPEEEIWAKVGEITGEVQEIKERRHTLLDHIEGLSITPLTGIPIALAVMLLAFSAVRLVGETLIANVFDPLFSLYLPYVERLGEYLGGGILHDLLIGTMVNGRIDFLQSMGLLTTGIYVPIAMVLPYVFSFYLVLGLLEDSGYLPRLATLLDTFMHRLGMHGLAIVPMLLGFGCNVPGALATRILETKRQRFIAGTIMAISIPCMAQTAMVFGLLGAYGTEGLGIYFLALFFVWLSTGLLMNRMIKGVTPETFFEIPPYRLPSFRALTHKMVMRMRHFIAEAVPFVLLGVFIVNLLYATGIISLVGEIASPVVTGILGLPKEAVAAMVIGFLRKDVAVGMLLPLGLSLKQLIIASVALTMYFPCVATFAVLFREFGVRDMAKSAAIMIAATLAAGGLLNLVLV